MQISVRTLGAEEVVALIADPAETVHSIQSRAACAFGKAPGRARMVFRVGQLPCSASLSDVGVMDGSELQLVILPSVALTVSRDGPFRDCPQRLAGVTLTAGAMPRVKYKKNILTSEGGPVARPQAALQQSSPP